ncbi:hypothetical protein ACFSTH_04780 [Paenibacillus yanchengensis]|uniref:Core-binding (CB) domain-containing protein n=1 Tax=Paenibacillus yanchengensis TaxID=2035833 RepID=A0ABW4YJW8_9BACL
MTNFEFQLDNFMLYCSSKNLSRKTLVIYEQMLRLIEMYLKDTFQIEDAKKVQSGHIRQYKNHDDLVNSHALAVQARKSGKLYV